MLLSGWDLVLIDCTYHVVCECPDDKEFLLLLLPEVLFFRLARLGRLFLGQLHLGLPLLPRQVPLEVEAGGVLRDRQQDEAYARDEPDVLHLHPGGSRRPVTETFGKSN